MSLMFLAGAALLANAGLLLQSVRTQPDRIRGIDSVDYVGRFASARTSLPARSTVGYLTDDAVGAVLEDSDAMEGYLWARYALVPVDLAETPNYPRVIGDFPSARSDNRAYADRLPHEWIVQRDFGAGVLLLARTNR